MELVLTVNGMSCGHCEGRVKKVLEAIDGVKEAKADHDKCEVVITLEKEVDEAVLKEAITGAGYEVK